MVPASMRPAQYGGSTTANATYIAAHIHAMPGQLCLRMRIHTAMPMLMSVAMTSTCAVSAGP